MTLFEFRFMKRKEKRERGTYRPEIPRMIIPEKLMKKLPKRSWGESK